MSPSIAIVGMACRYPDARSPRELWENALAKRRAFRRIPPERLRIEDYAPRSEGDPDSTSLTHAALLEGYAFDRVRFGVGARAFRAADTAHWLALDVAAEALADAGFTDAGGADLPRDTTGVVLGNTLTGDRSRADALRLRFPYVRRVVEAELASAGVADRDALLATIEARFKAPFASPDEDTLAGGLSSTIAGRICNHLDLRGGGYVVDGACASSLLAVTTACSALVAGDLDVAIAGGVDLSLDPFELVGFARVGALATDAMRIYDARSAGFWPGEGAGFVVLMRHEDAIARGRRAYAMVRGWGVSSDGSGGITRPARDGHLRALRRAYARAGFGVDTVGYFEGHGTGTAVGDAVELAAIALARREASDGAPPAAIGSIKANIGHTKAAAGVAGIIKATCALHTQIVPPTTGCETPHPEIAAHGALRVPSEAEPWPRDQPLRAGVSALGFGGINAHVALEGVASAPRAPHVDRDLTATQDAEVFLLGAPSLAGLASSLAALSTIAPRLAFAEMGDLAASLARRLPSSPLARAAIVASSPDELASRVAQLSARLRDGRAAGVDPGAGVFLGAGDRAPRIGYLFPGQGAPAAPRGGAIERRFAWARALYDAHPLPEVDEASSTAIAQPAIVLASLVGLSALDRLGVTASVAVGHSLGELVALHWAGAVDRDALVRIAIARGAAFAELGLAGGAMIAVAAGERDVDALIEGTSAVIAALNAPNQTVVSGGARTIATVVERARARGLATSPLRVGRAFHSPLVAAAAPALAARLAGDRFPPIARSIVSTVTGAELAPDHDLRALLVAQVTAPVRFAEALERAARGVDLFVEVGPRRTLAALAGEIARVPAIAIDVGGPSLVGLLSAFAASFALGAPVDPIALFKGRLIRPFDPDTPPRFLTNPCASGPVSSTALPDMPPAIEACIEPRSTIDPSFGATLDIVSRAVAERTDLPLASLRPGARLLRDLHLSSIAVGRVVTDVAKLLGVTPSRAPTEYADATLEELARALDEARSMGTAPEPEIAPGVDAWVHAFTIAWVPRPRGAPALAPRCAVLAAEGDPLAAPLREAMGSGAAEGVIVCLPEVIDRAAVARMLEGARRCREAGDAGPFVLVRRGAGAAFAKTLHLEMPHVPTAVVEVPDGDPRAASWILAEAAAATTFHEARYDRDGARLAPVLRLATKATETRDLAIQRGDLILVTGGGKGITAECALSLARESGARLLLLGRASPASDRELARNLDRFAAAGVDARYVVADITHADALRGAITDATAALGPIDGVLHGAGSNTPTRLGSLGEAAFLRTLAVKVDGLRNVLAAIDPARLRVLVAFGSIIGRAGMPGEADYAVANEELARVVDRFSQAQRGCRSLTVEWSVWSGVGMGERLGHMEALLRRGITPIAPEVGVAMLGRLLRSREARTSVVVTGRFGALPTLDLDRPELPLRRFLERPIAHVPGVELIAESEIDAASDPYLADHVIDGNMVFPAVIALEAMAQAASALAGAGAPTAFEGVRFSRPITVSEGAKTRLRVAALARDDGGVDVVIRSDATGFTIDHVEATCRFGEPAERATRVALPADRIALDARDLYRTTLFQRGRFQRLAGFRRLAARACVAEIAAPGADAWFGRFLPQASILGDHGARDATLHALQACVPHATLVPVAAEAIAITGPGAPAAIHAVERSHEGDTFTYDIDVTDIHGCVVERWTRLVLRVVRVDGGRGAWPPPLLGPHLERRLRDLLPRADLSIAVSRDPLTARPAKSDRAIAQAIGAPVIVHRRPDGRPEIASSPGVFVSVAHAGDLTIAIAAATRASCDVEPVEARPAAVWRELLGERRFPLAEIVAREAGEDLDRAGTRIWTAIEALSKAGVPLDAPLVLARSAGDAWLVLASGPLSIASVIVAAAGEPRPLAFALLVEEPHARL